MQIATDKSKLVSLNKALQACQQAIVDFPVKTANAGPFDITSGPDGKLWFTETAVNQIGWMSVDGKNEDVPVPTLNSAPYIITTGPDGKLWFTENAVTASKIGRITVGGMVDLEKQTPTGGSQPRFITVGPDGNLWFVENATNRIGRITPDGVIIDPFSILTAASGPSGLVAGTGCKLWFTETNVDQIGLFALDGISEFPLPINPIGPRGPTSIVLGPDGNLWFAEHDSDIIGRIRLDGTFNGNPDEFHLSDFLGIGVKRGPVATTAGPDGNVWFTEKDANRIGRLNPWVLP